ncbi:MAG TPA: Mut7-C RNAse domain-containing protein [candidate division Zixibacteria bacterium]|nr:Mut7-C RNAse domain-containing protein [candidate division Zixibacteria bacterium]
MMRAYFRFRGELNDFLPANLGQEKIPYQLNGPVAVKHCIEALGVPHTEVDLILVEFLNYVGFSYLVGEGDRIEVYPVGHADELETVRRLCPNPPCHPPRFILDGHLGRLATYLRLLGFDAQYHNDIEDEDIARIAFERERVLLTRDVRLLMRKNIDHGYWLRSKDPMEQIREVLKRYMLANSITPWGRCLRCNGQLEEVLKEDILDRLESLTKKHYHEFHICQDCDQIYWKGSHYQPLRQLVSDIGGEAE